MSTPAARPQDVPPSGTHNFGGFLTAPSYQTIPQPNNDYNSVLVTLSADFNKDGSADIATLDTDGNLNIMLNDKKGHFAAPITNSSAPTVYGGSVYFIGAIVADVDGDGYPDVIAKPWVSAYGTYAPDATINLAIFHNNHDGTFATPTTLAVLQGDPINVGAFLVTDVNGDAGPSLRGQPVRRGRQLQHHYRPDIPRTGRREIQHRQPRPDRLYLFRLQHRDSEQRHSLPESEQQAESRYRRPGLRRRRRRAPGRNQHPGTARQGRWNIQRRDEHRSRFHRFLWRDHRQHRRPEPDGPEQRRQPGHHAELWRRLRLHRSRPAGWNLRRAAGGREHIRDQPRRMGSCRRQRRWPAGLHRQRCLLHCGLPGQRRRNLRPAHHRVCLRRERNDHIGKLPRLQLCRRGFRQRRAYGFCRSSPAPLSPTIAPPFTLTAETALSLPLPARFRPTTPTHSPPP